MSAERNKEIVRAIYEAFNAGDYRKAFESMADDYTLEVIGTAWVAGTFRGREKMLRELIPHVFPEGVRFVIKNIVAEGDTVMVEWENLATHQGRVYEGRAVEVFHLKNGRVRSCRAYVDTERQKAFFGQDREKYIAGTERAERSKD